MPSLGEYTAATQFANHTAEFDSGVAAGTPAEDVAAWERVVWHIARSVALGNPASATWEELAAETQGLLSTIQIAPKEAPQ